MEDMEDEKKMETYVAFWVEGVLLIIVGIFGIVGNLAAIAVFARQHLQKNFHALMLSLSIFDLIYIIASIFLFGMKELNESYRTMGINFLLFPWGLPIAQIGITGSIYFTLAITVERYVTVCHPFYRVSHSWPWWKLVVPLVAFSILYNTPKFFELQTSWDSSANNNTGQYQINATWLRMDENYYEIYCMWMNFILMGLGPFVVLITLNTLTFMELKNLGDLVSHGPDGAANRRRDLILAKVSLAIVFVFIICHSIKWIPNIYELMQIGSKKAVMWPSWVEIFSNFSHLLTVFNSSVNFYIYFAKHWRVILGRPESPDRQDRTEVLRLTTRASVVVHDNNHYPSLHGTRLPNQHENAVEHTTMLVNAVVSASNDGEPQTQTRNGEVHC